MPFVEFRNVQKSYDGKTQIVHNLNLTIDKGEFVSMLGPSGSGKTTCLMMLAGFESVTSGDILINGAPVHSIPPNKRNIGMVFQNYALFPHMTVYENLAFPLQIRKRPKAAIDLQVEKVLAMVRLEHFSSRRISQLSGGQQQRVAVARALAFEPEIVLMDEPLGALDKNLREEMQFEIKHLHERLGVTILYVTHDQSEAITMSDRVAVFNDGKVQQYSPPPELYESPQNAFVANFIGENNTLVGVLKQAEGDQCSIDVNGKTLTGIRITTGTEGDQALLSVRPEKVRLTPPDTVLNQLEACVEEIIYMGDHTRIVLKLFNEQQFVAKVLNNQSKSHYQTGEELKIGWGPEHCCVLDPE